jgi:membrane protein
MSNPAFHPGGSSVGASTKKAPPAMPVQQDVGVIRHLWQVAQVAFVGLRRTQLTRMAAALAFRTIFGIIPVLVISLVVLAAYASEQQVKDAVTKMLEFAGIKQIVVGGGESAAGSVSIPFLGNGGLGGSVMGGGPTTGSKTPLDSGIQLFGSGPVLPQMSGETTSAKAEIRLDEWITERVQYVRSLPLGKMGVVGVLLLVYAAVGMLVEIEKSFNQIFNAPEGRSFVRRFMQYWTLISFGGLLLLVTLFVAEGVNNQIGNLTTGIVSGGATQAVLLTFISRIITVVISTGLLLLIFMTVPNTRVQFTPALIGAFFSASLWELGKWGFTSYLKYSVGYTRLYGVLAVIPLFMLWIYVTWLITLLGVQVAAAIQTYRLAFKSGLTHALFVTLGLIDENLPASKKIHIVDPASILVVLGAVAQKFVTGESIDRARIAEVTRLDEEAVDEMLKRLTGAGLVHQVLNPQGEPTGVGGAAFTLAKPAEAIDALDVLQLSDDLNAADRGEGAAPAPALLAAINQARQSAFAGRTLADVMGLAGPVRVLTPAGAEGGANGQSGGVTGTSESASAS